MVTKLLGCQMYNPFSYFFQKDYEKYKLIEILKTLEIDKKCRTTFCRIFEHYRKVFFMYFYTETFWIVKKISRSKMTEL